MTPPSRPPKRSPDTAERTLGRGAESPPAEDRPRRMPQTPSGSFSDDSVTIARLDGFCFSCFEQSGNQRPSGAPRKTAQLRWCLIGTLIFPVCSPSPVGARMSSGRMTGPRRRVSAVGRPGQQTVPRTLESPGASWACSPAQLWFAPQQFLAFKNLLTRQFMLEGKNEKPRLLFCLRFLGSNFSAAFISNRILCDSKLSFRDRLTGTKITGYSIRN